MNAMQKIKGAEALQTVSDDLDTYEADIDHDAAVRPLRAALRSVEQQMETSAFDDDDADEDYLDELILKNLSEAEADDAEPADETYDDFSPVGTEGDSARILELNSKLGISRDMQATIQQGAELLHGLAKRASQLSGYLEKSEVELARLESVEARSEKLKEAATNLSRKYHEMKTVMDEQRQQIALLEDHKAESRETIEKARSEVSRLLEEKMAFSSEITMLKAAKTKLESDKQGMLDKIEQANRSNEDLVAKLKTATRKVSELTDSNLHADKELAKANSKLVEMDQSVERYQVDLADIRAKFENVNASYVATKTRLDETQFRVDSSRREFEEIIRLKDKRNAELDAQNQVLGRQVALNEDIIARLEGDLKASEGHLENEKDGKKATAGKTGRKPAAGRKRTLN